jgi:hypothetical protein
MASNADIDVIAASADPRSGASLVPMLVAGLVMIVVGMFVALILV